MRDLRLTFEDVCIPLWIGFDCTEEVVAKLCELEASSYHVVTDKTVAQLHGAAQATGVRLHVGQDGDRIDPSTADAEATQLTPGTITSSYAPTSQASSAIVRPAVPVEHGTQKCAPV